MYVLAVCVVCLFILGLAALAAWQGRERYRERGLMATQNLARLYEHRLSDRFEKLDVSLQLLAQAYTEQLSHGGTQADSLQALLKLHQNLHPEFLSLGIGDAQGELLLTDAGVPPQPIRMADRGYFEQARAHPAPGLIVDGPLVSRLDQRAVLVLARRLSAPDGSFAGVLFAAVTTDALAPILASAELGPEGASTLRTADLALVHRVPDARQAVGSREISPTLNAAVAKDPSAGSFVAESPLDGVERNHAYRRLTRYPFYVMVGLGTASDQASWRAEALSLAGLALLAVLMTVLAAALLYRGTALLAAREAEMHKLQQLAGMGNWSWDTFTDHHHWSEQVYRLCGRSPAAGPLSFVQMQRHFSVETWEALSEHMERCQREGTAFQCETECLLDDGRHRWLSIFGEAKRNAKGQIRWLHGTLQDISAIKQSQAEMEHWAYHDALTGLPNRLLLMDRLPQALALAQREQKLLALCYLDLDGFKPVNDVHGHAAGDLVLQVVADRLSQCLRGNDTVARLGGDEFVVLLNQLDRPEEARLALQRMIEALQQPIPLEALDASEPAAKRVSISASAGVALFPNDATLHEVLLGHADLALYESKRRGRSQICFYAELAAAVRNAAPAVPVSAPPTA